MSSVETGRQAEELASSWLEQKGLTILDRNWRTRWCEIDIVAVSDKTIHFIEVKYRRSAAFGTGYEYITRDKARRLRRSALMWLSSNSRTDRDYQIDVIAVSGSPKPKEVSYLPNAVYGN